MADGMGPSLKPDKKPDQRNNFNQQAFHGLSKSPNLKLITRVTTIGPLQKFISTKRSRQKLKPYVIISNRWRLKFKNSDNKIYKRENSADWIDRFNQPFLIYLLLRGSTRKLYEVSQAQVSLFQLEMPRGKRNKLKLANLILAIQEKIKSIKQLKNQMVGEKRRRSESQQNQRKFKIDQKYVKRIYNLYCLVFQSNHFPSKQVFTCFRSLVKQYKFECQFSSSQSSPRGCGLLITLYVAPLLQICSISHCQQICIIQRSPSFSFYQLLNLSLKIAQISFNSLFPHNIIFPFPKFTALMKLAQFASVSQLIFNSFQPFTKLPRFNLQMSLELAPLVLPQNEQIKLGSQEQAALAHFAVNKQGCCIHFFLSLSNIQTYERSKLSQPPIANMCYSSWILVIGNVLFAFLRGISPFEYPEGNIYQTTFVRCLLVYQPPAMIAESARFITANLLSGKIQSVFFLNISFSSELYMYNQFEEEIGYIINLLVLVEHFLYCLLPFFKLIVNIRLVRTSEIIAWISEQLQLIQKLVLMSCRRSQSA